MAGDSRVSGWFIPFAPALTILTAPLSFRDPLVVTPALIAATGLGVHTWWKERPGGFLGAFLLLQLALLVFISVGMALLLLG